MSLSLRSDAEALAAPLPPLLAQAEQLAATVILGEHGRRRPGLGDSFWQYRPAHATDGARAIDWRRSARSDATFVQDKEWQVAQSVMLWVDGAASMSFASKGQPEKGHRARLLGLATAILLTRGGERVGLAAPPLPPRRGRAQIAQLASLLGQPQDADYGIPVTTGAPTHARALFLSDFLGPLQPIEEALARAADREMRGALVQVLDPEEESFPYKGRTVFESMGGSLSHETLKAGDLRAAYLDRLAERQARLAELARLSGWHFTTHRTDTPATPALGWIHGALERRA